MNEILELFRGKRIAFLENGESLDDECEALSVFLTENGITFDAILNVEDLGANQVFSMCSGYGVLVFQTTWVYSASQELKQMFLSTRNPEEKKTFVEIYVCEPTFHRKPEGTIHEMYTLNNYLLEPSAWQFERID